jgi:hypothetical protein
MQWKRVLLPIALAAVTAGRAVAGPLDLYSLPLASPWPAVDPVLASIAYVPGHSGGAGYTGPVQPRNEVIRYRERGYHPNMRPPRSSTQIQFGFYDADKSNDNSFVFGLRGGPLIGPHAQIGALVGWQHQSSDSTVIVGQPYLQGGTVITPTRVLSRASSNLYPMMLYLQLFGSENRPIVPYAGIAGGYEILWVSADDYFNATHFDGTFGGWGWQAWAGAGIPMSGHARLTGELFLNQSTPARDIYLGGGYSYRESVNADGVGMRFGLEWGF